MRGHVHPNRLREFAKEPETDSPDWEHIKNCDQCQRLIAAFVRDIQEIDKEKDRSQNGND
jgi:hypothetical protein